MKQEHGTLVLHLGALGDFILALPAIARLGARVEAWGPSRERLSIAVAPRGPLAATGALSHELFHEDDGPCAQLERFERVVAFTRDDHGPLARRIRRIGGHLIPPFPPSGEALHVSDFLCRAVETRGLARMAGPAHPELAPTPDDLAAADRLLASRVRPIVVQPGAGGRGKRWNSGRFGEAARALSDATGAPFVVVLGPAELDGPPEPRKHWGGALVLEAPPLVTLAGILARARLFLGNDAGVGHLAAAVGAPVVSVFGPTDSRVWRPRGRGPVRVVEAPGGDLSRLEPARVVEAARDALAAREADV